MFPRVPRRPLLVLLLGVLAVALGLERWITLGERPSATLPARAPPAGAPERGASALLPLDVGPTRAALVAGAEDRPPPDGDEPRTVHLQGSLTVDGEASFGDGRFELRVWGPPEPPRASDPAPHDARSRERLRRQHVTTVPIRGGRWEVEVPAHAERGYAKATLGGLPLTDLRALELDEGDTGVVAVRLEARALHPARLTVVDRATGRFLERARVVALDPGDPREHPGDLAPTREGDATPLVLPPTVARRSYLVGADGHAWKRVDWDHLRPEERVVELEPSGALAVRVELDAPLAPWELVLSDAAGTPCTRLAAAASVSIEGLAPGAYRLALAPRADAASPGTEELTAAAARVLAGGTSSVVLRGELGPPPEPVELAGRVRMPAAWSAGGPHLVVRALGTTALRHLDTGGLLGGLEVSGAGDAWTFSSSEAVPGGTYLLVEQRTWTAREIRVAPRGTHDVELEVPPPVVVTVEVVDGASGAPLPACELAWLPPPLPTGARPRASGPLWIEADGDGGFRARVPRLEALDFEARAPDGTTAGGTLRPDAGPVCLRIALGP